VRGGKQSREYLQTELKRTLGSYAGESKRGESPSFFFFPLSSIGEGDTGGEVDKIR